MVKSWTTYLTLWTTESDVIERKLRLRNTTNKGRRHGYESQITSTGGEVWEERFNEPAGADRTCPTAFADSASCHHDQVGRRATVTSENVVDWTSCRHRISKEFRCVVVWIGEAVDWYILLGWTCVAIYALLYFSLNFGHCLSTVYGLVYLSPDGKWGCEKLGY